MDEKSVANRLDNIFSDTRLKPIYLSMLTRKLFGPYANHAAGEWWMYHNMDIEDIIAENIRPTDLSQYD